VDNDARCAELLEQRRVLGETSPLVRSMQDAEFMDQGETMVFSVLDIDRAMGGMLPRYGIGDHAAALDLALGGDEAPMYWRDGNECQFVRSWQTRDDDKLVTEAIAHLTALGVRPEQVTADDSGLGAVMLNSFARRGWNVYRLRGENKARNQKWYANVRAEMYFTLADRLRRGEVRLPKDERLRDQLAKQQYLPVSPLQLVPKEQLKGSGWKSPDRSDAVAMLFYNMALPGQLVPGAGFGGNPSAWTHSKTIPEGGDRAAIQRNLEEIEAMRGGGDRW
jgi:hypothetical protein